MQWCNSTTQRMTTLKSTRYCMNCEEYRRFVYNPVIMHSECSECGLRWSMREKPTCEICDKRKEKINELHEIIKKQNEKIDSLNAQIWERNDTVGQLRKLYKQLMDKKYEKEYVPSHGIIINKEL